MNLNQITLPSTNLERSILFYERLGHRLIVSSLPLYARFECVEGDSTFSIHKVDQISTDSQVIIYFEVKNLDITVQNLVTQGIVFDEMPEDKPWLWREARLKDPDNNLLIIYFAGINRKNPPWRIISEPFGKT